MTQPAAAQNETRIFDLLGSTSTAYSMHIGGRTITGYSDWQGAEHPTGASNAPPTANFCVDFGPVQIKTAAEARDVKALLTLAHIVSVRFKTANRHCDLHRTNDERVRPELLVGDYMAMTILCAPGAWNFATLNLRRQQQQAVERDALPMVVMDAGVFVPFIRTQVKIAIAVLLGQAAILAYYTDKHNALVAVNWLLLVSVLYSMWSAGSVLGDVRFSYVSFVNPTTPNSFWAYIWAVTSPRGPIIVTEKMTELFIALRAEL